MKKIVLPTFLDFLEKFPVIKLPVVLTEEAQEVFSKENPPLPKLMIEQFILPMEEEGAFDEFTEYIACFSIPATHDFHAIVYWKAGLMNYEYILATFDKNGRLIQKEVIAGTQVKHDSLLRTVATIEEDWMISGVVGVASAKNDLSFNPATSLPASHELLSDGQIINHI